MKPPKRNDTGPRVFLTGLRFFDIAYLPGSGQVVSYLPPLPPPAEVGEVAGGLEAGDGESPPE